MTDQQNIESLAARHASSMGRAAARTGASTDALFALWKVWCEARGCDVAIAWNVAVDAYFDALEDVTN